jgi:two-component system phosphate regulon response regulator PhoB
MAREAIPDLMLLDWMMPGRTGLEVAEALRDDPKTSDIPIVMLTSRNQKGDIDRAAAAGVHAHLTKPFSPLELLQTVSRAL